MKYNAAMGMVALVAGISFNTPAQAELCEYEAYSMQGIMEYINSDLQRQGFSYAPGLNVLEFQCNGSTILSESAAYGCLESLEDRYSGSKAARFQDAYGKVVGSLSETIYTCTRRHAAGRCTRSDFATVQEPIDQFGNWPFSIIEDQTYGMIHLRYGRETNVTLWRYALKQALHDFIPLLTDDRIALRLYSASPMVGLQIALLSDPVISPFYPLIKISEEGTSVIIGGMVPSDRVHRHIVDHAIRLRIFNLRMNVTIDTRIPDWYLPERPRRCRMY